MPQRPKAAEGRNQRYYLPKADHAYAHDYATTTLESFYTIEKVRTSCERISRAILCFHRVVVGVSVVVGVGVGVVGGETSESQLGITRTKKLLKKTSFYKPVLQTSTTMPLRTVIHFVVTLLFPSGLWREESLQILLARSPRFQSLLEKSRRSIRAGKGLSATAFWKAVADRDKIHPASKASKKQPQQPPRNFAIWTPLRRKNLVDPAPINLNITQLRVRS